ncbi:MAG TPA: glycosyltransferase, partial [Polyangia bacterium]|nr:glycosyltransferase [Polyangia bacterium]
MIVHVLGNMTAGGNERLCLELVRRGPPDVGRALITIDPVPAGPLKRLFETIPDLQIACEPYHRNARLRFVLGLAKRLRQLRPTGIITYPFGLHLLIALAARAVPDARFIAHVGNPPPPFGPRRAVFSQIVYASRLMRTPLWSCSETVHDQFVRLGLGMPRDSRPMPNGVNIEALREGALQGRSARPAGGPIITMTARLDAIKDHDTLLRAFALVRRQLPAARLWLAGDGNRREALERLGNDLGLGQSL